MRFAILLHATLFKLFRLRLINKWVLLFEIFSTTSMLLVFFLIDRFQGSFLNEQIRSTLAGMNTGYFGYVALGLAVSVLANSSVGGVLGQFQEEKRYNTLEIHLISGCSIQSWSVVAGIANLFRSLFQFLLIYGVAVGILGLNVPNFNWGLALLVLSCSFIPLWCLALLSLCSVLLFRRGNIFGFLVSTAFELLGGVYVPLTVLPLWLKNLSEILPITPALRAMHKVFYQAGEFSAISGDLKQLLILGFVFLPLSLFLLSLTDRVAKRKAHYVLE